jgi:ATP-dependent Lon protease
MRPILARMILVSVVAVFYAVVGPIAWGQTRQSPLVHHDLAVTMELVSKVLGISDWNTLSALLQSEGGNAAVPHPTRGGRAANWPALPIRDFVPFPTMTFPLFVAREKTKQALDQAFHGNREVVLVTQKDEAVEEPSLGDVYEVGVLARLLELERLPDGTTFGHQRLERLPDGTTLGHKRLQRAMKIVVQAHRRVVVCRFIGEAGAFQAEIADVSEGPITDAPELVCKAVDRFESYTEARKASMPQAWSPDLRQIRDPGHLADVISQHMALPVSEKQNLLATLDPVARLEKVTALMDGE